MRSPFHAHCLEMRPLALIRAAIALDALDVATAAWNAPLWVTLAHLAGELGLPDAPQLIKSQLCLPMPGETQQLLKKLLAPEVAIPSSTMTATAALLLLQPRMVDPDLLRKESANMDPRWAPVVRLRVSGL